MNNQLGKKEIKSKVKFGFKVFTTVIIVIMLVMLLSNSYLRPTYVNFALNIILMTLSVVLIWRKNNFSEKVNKLAGWVIFIFTPMLAFFLADYYNHMLAWEYDNYRTFINMLVYWAIIGFVLLVTNSTKIASITLIIITVLYGFLNHFIYVFRGEPIVASDISSAGTALSVASSYKISIDYTIFLILVITLAYSILVCKIKSFKSFKWKIRLVSVALYGMLIFECLNVYFLTTDITNHGLLISLWSPQRSYRANGTACTLVASFRYIMVVKPEGYSPEAAQKLMEPYLEEETEESTSTDTATETPNIIGVMNEAFSDLKLISDFDTNEEVLPFWNSMSEDTVQGTMYVSVYGGNTANTEFEFLTGNSMAFLPQRSVAYQLFIKNTLGSLTYSLESQGYSGNIALHPYQAKGWNRPKVYPLLGFSEFLTEDDFSLPNFIRCYISDESSFEKITEEYEAAQESDSDSPFFLFNVTMQNHGAYDREYANLPDDIQITDTSLVNYDKAYAERYLNLTHLTDEAYKNLIEYYEKIEDPTIIIMFGDHQPAIQELQNQLLKSTDTEGQQDKYKVPFRIWANYDIEEQEIDRISANYLSGLLCETAGIELTPYQKYLKDLQEDIPVITANGYWGEDGNYYKLDDETSPYWEEVNNYNIIEYNNMFDVENRVNSFFFMDEEQAKEETSTDITTDVEQ